MHTACTAQLDSLASRSTTTTPSPDSVSCHHIDSTLWHPLKAFPQATANSGAPARTRHSIHYHPTRLMKKLDAGRGYSSAHTDKTATTERRLKQSNAHASQQPKCTTQGEPAASNQLIPDADPAPGNKLLSHSTALYIPDISCSCTDQTLIRLESTLCSTSSWSQ
jgi:hypothetical protein